ncbi:MAG: hypothetical protein CVT93_03165 [Bacteroidetes bacterium HGW-Bacteroidetes-10]|nr:MAG: hypothetical protein CVT93_03165 [Bacteroidetes bacterium HGW-Bacteroidetes-10]
MKKLLFLISFVLFFAVSCDKAETQFADDNDMMTQDAVIEQVSAESNGILDEIISFGMLGVQTKAIWGERFLSEGVILTVKDSASIRIVTVDFGTTGVKGADGKVRSGKLVGYFSVTDKTNFQQKLRYVGYKIDGYQYSGEVIRVITRQIDLHTQQAVITENVKVVFPDGVKFVTRVANMTRVIMHGEVGTLEDNFIKTFGTISITNELGAVYTKTIAETTPLMFKVIPGEIVSGIAKITQRNGRNISMDYGDGTVDNTATLTDGTKTWTIQLRRVQTTQN